MRQLAKDRGLDDAEAPWYADRNDLRLSVAGGYASPTYERAGTLTYDRQSQYAGRVTDHYYETSYRVRLRETAE